ncbi:MAG: glycoside hydrolase family 99-like domain-containing protein [Thomasclavelia ramosa]|nr:glycoside hydrolase family 99-like domain-containing protein [Thomasclavelia ramosa]MDD8057390.1 glycoside hydrolase family 99-like domain-containing protein [Thomasclavelia ramosa]
MKVLAMYLPQYHAIKENDEWWGKGYTEWSAVRSAVPYYKGHVEPRIPLNDNYYNLADESASAWKWQSEIAKDNNVYGFCIYHYWFETGKQLLEKPMEILLNHPEIEINYCISWANETWTRTWYGLETKVLMEQKYGDKSEWKNHFDYLLPFFKDTRYIKINNRPLVNIYHTAEIEKLGEMKKYWEELAVKNGFDGIWLVSGNTNSAIDSRTDIMDAYYNFEPSYSFKHKYSRYSMINYKVRTSICSLLNKVTKSKRIERRVRFDVMMKTMEKDDIIQNVKTFPGAFPQWDNTPRRKYKGTEFFESTPEKFRTQLEKMKNKYKDAEFIYVNAWNEWGEGCYLEPDKNYEYGYLNVIKQLFEEKDF